jgi:hypothetical protein
MPHAMFDEFKLVQQRSKTMNKGMFVNFNLTYQHNGEGLSYQQQAEKILKKATELVANGAKGVAITYSANYGQTRKIEQVYFAGDWNTQTDGSNQAEVMKEMESLLGSENKNLQGKMCIVPITTMNAYDDPADPWNDDVLMGIVTTDLDRIKIYLEGGWHILGWQNQDTVNNPKHPYAVGGGVAKLPLSVSDKIQNTLIGYAQKYTIE